MALALVVAAFAAAGSGQEQAAAPRNAERQDFILIDGKRLPPPVRNEPLIGTVVAFAAPQDTGQDSAVSQWLERQGWMLCDGRPLKETEYQMLFDLIGRSHGAGYENNGSGRHADGMQFNLPDYRGRFLRGVSRDSGRDEEASDRPRMNNEGNEGNLVGSVQEYGTKLPKTAFTTTTSDPHHHTGETDEDGDHSHKIPHDSGHGDGSDPFALARINHRVSVANQSHVTTRDGAHTHHFTTSNVPGHSHTVNAGGDRETRPINANVSWIIKVRYVNQ
jgi:microcystin-dependent protein